MRIIVNHLTRMSAPRICVAGIDEVSETHIRPVSGAAEPLTRALLADAGGPFELGALVDLGDVEAVPSAPEVEDHRFEQATATRVRRLDDTEYLELLERLSAVNLESIFGAELEQRGRSYAVEEGQGSASLGILRVQTPTRLRVDSWGKLRLKFEHAGEPVQLGVTDLRFVDDDHATLRHDVIEDVDRRMRDGVDLMLMVGLARAFRAAGDDRNRHWVQVNGICLLDRPLGDAP
jgi:hypothetical protein